MPAITPDLLERARGALLGAAVGDAFGMALDGAPPRHVNAQLREMQRGRLPAGHFTDSTGALLTVGESLLAPQPLDDEELAARLAALQRPRHPRAGASGQTLLGRLLGRGPQAQTAAGDGAAELEVADAGSLARCLASALASIGDQNACLSRARSLTRLTHRHPDCVAGGAFVAVVLWHVLHGMAPRQAVWQGLKSCGDLSETLEEAIRLAPTRRRDYLDNGHLVQPMLESVVRSLLSTASFAEAVTRVTNLGGNATVAGALVGALAGAVYRHSGIPADWRTRVHGIWPPRGGRMWREPELVELANQLLLAWDATRLYAQRPSAPGMTISA